MTKAHSELTPLKKQRPPLAVMFCALTQCSAMICAVPQVGSVVYSTCSLHPEENEELVTRAVKQAKDKVDKTSRKALTKFRSAFSYFPSFFLPVGIGAQWLPSKSQHDREKVSLNTRSKLPLFARKSMEGREEMDFPSREHTVFSAGVRAD